MAVYGPLDDCAVYASGQKILDGFRYNNDIEGAHAVHVIFFHVDTLAIPELRAASCVIRDHVLAKTFRRTRL
jgi:hypothetical protein